jgi:hypothetical protein
MNENKGCACKCARKGEDANESCRYFIDYPEDDNCCFVAIEKHGDMNLEDIAARMGVTFQRIQQTETAALKKIAFRLKKIEDN